MTKVEQALQTLRQQPESDLATVVQAMRNSGARSPRAATWLALADIIENIGNTPLVRTDDHATSQKAAAKVERAITAKRREVLEYALFRSDKGFTDDELIVKFSNAPESTYRKRRTELTQDGDLEDTGMERPNRAGNMQTVWRITDKGRIAA